MKRNGEHCISPDLQESQLLKESQLLEESAIAQEIAVASAGA
jgi:hypothetical protein